MDLTTQTYDTILELVRTREFEPERFDYKEVLQMADVLLEPDQEQLLEQLVRAAKNVPGAQRRKFLVNRTMTSQSIIHLGLPGGSIDAYFGDVQTLDRAGLVAITDLSDGTPAFDVTPQGTAHYERLKLAQGEPTQRVETEIRSYLNSGVFRRKYAKAYQKWAEAEALLWGSHAQAQLTTIGHLCREAIQEYATALVDLHQPPLAPADKAKDVARIRAVLDHVGPRIALGTTTEPFLKGLLGYWGVLTDLVQRQAHGAQKENRPLTWEDARRVVFHTGIVMFEVDCTLS